MTKASLKPSQNAIRRASRWTYEEAKAWAQSQKITDVKMWRALRKSKDWPSELAPWPQTYYATQWVSWGGFLGTGNLACMRRSFLPYEEAKTWTQTQQPPILSKNAWYERVAQGNWPVDMPTDPRSHYGKTFRWGDFLGTGRIHTHERKTLSYKDLCVWVRSQSPAIPNRVAYEELVRKLALPHLPVSPLSVYGKEFEGWADFLQLRAPASTSLIERLLKQELQALGCPVDARRTTRLPTSIRTVQVDIVLPEWKLIIEYDGARYHADKVDRDLEKTSLLLKDRPGWVLVRLREAPMDPLNETWDVVVNQMAHPLSKAQTLVRHLLALGVVPRTSKKTLTDYLNRDTLLSNPENVMRWRSYEDAKAWACQQQPPLKGRKDWYARIKASAFLPSDIPTTPSIVYGDRFKSWGDFLGTGTIHTQDWVFWSYEKAAEWAKQSGITTSPEWHEWCVAGRLPKGLPSNPNSTYASSWKGWGAFLGTGVLHPKHRPRRSFAEVLVWAGEQSPPIVSQKEWLHAKDQPWFPADIPKCLYNGYKKEFQGFPLTIEKQTVKVR